MNVDFIAGQIISFFVRATDRGNPPKHSEVAVQLKVIDDKSAIPLANNEHYQFSIDENVLIGTTIGQLQQASQHGMLF